MEAIGPLLTLVSMPLILRWIPPNRFYGLRIPATLGDESVWYDVNAMHGRHLLALGLLMVALDFVLPTSTRTMALAATGWIGLAGIVVADWRTANRLRRQRAAR
jgi:uncharacterized membrane protein